MSRSLPTSLCVLVGVFSLGLGGGPTSAQDPQAEIAIEGQFAGKKKGEPANDLSGIACQPRGSEYSCLVVNDESPFAQFATLRDRRLSAGATIDLIAERGARLAGDAPPAGMFGSEAAARPVVAGRCADRELERDFDEFDGEGVAWAPAASGGVFYVAGSHACGRSSGTRRRSTHLLARIRVDASGKVSGTADLTWRLGEALRGIDSVAAHYGLALNPSQQGLDIEGVAALDGGDDLLFGLRAPSLAGHAFIVRARAADLFAQTAATAPPARIVRLPLGDGVGIRDLAALPDGRVLVLTGAPQEQAGVPQRLMLADPSDQPIWTVRPLVPDIKLPRADSKVEGVAVLGVTGNKVTVLLLFENISKDKPVEYVLVL